MHKILFIIFHSIFDPRFFFLYKKIQKNKNKSYIELKKQQEKQLYKIIKYVYKNIPYYKKLFDKEGINPSKIKKIKDLEKIPILTKEIIKKNINLFQPIKKQIKYINYFNNATGGTTGEPLKYKNSRKDRLISGILLYRGWANAGYQLGDKMIMLGGSSLSISKKTKIIQKINEFFRNIKKFSAFDMGVYEMKKITNTISTYKPKFIRGYPSAIYLLAQWIQKNNIQIYSPKAIFTTSENLYPKMRKIIEKIFKCKIFDNYGLYDGGLSTYECNIHKGMHIDTEKSILEVIDKNNKQKKEGKGKIIATDLYNTAFPFVRYDTGDIGTITHSSCKCGFQTPRIKISGRSVDVFKTPDGKNIHGWFFLYMFWKYQKGIDNYQVIQDKLDHITIKLVINKDFDKNQLKKIKAITQNKSPKWKIIFKFVKKIKVPKNGKYKFIVSKISK